MNENEYISNPELLNELRKLHNQLRDYTKKKYTRINPFIEDLFDWKEKGDFCGGKNVTIYDSTTIVGEVMIGDNTWVGPFCSLDGTGGLEIGSHCTIAASSHIFTHDTVRNCLSGGIELYEYAPVRIGSCCFVGAQTTIIKGIDIGDHSLISANSMINKSFPSYSIIAGNPGLLIGRVEIKYGKVILNYFK